jgi:hypothetical protein
MFVYSQNGFNIILVSEEKVFQHSKTSEANDSWLMCADRRNGKVYDDCYFF